MVKIFYILAGGALGALSRYAVSGLSHRLVETTFPVGTLVVNLLGSFVIGLLFGLLELSNVSSNVRSFLFIGILGSFTTFSSYTLETLNLFRDGEMKAGILNLFYNNVLGLMLVFLGFLSARMLIQYIR